MTTVCHITTVHTLKDTRIYHKECRALAEAGYDVKLVAVNASTTESDYPGLEIINVPVKFRSKIQRIMKAPRAARLVAENLRADLYHFHDPEFLFSAIKMSTNGKRIIYDAHEDVPNQIKNKAWIPKPIRRILSSIVRRLEEIAVSRFSALITVVDPILQRFSKVQKQSIIVANFPSLEEMPTPKPWLEKKSQLCYVGDLTEIRGIKTMTDALADLDVRLKLGGKFSSESFRSMTARSLGWKNVDELGFLDRSAVMKVYADSKVGMVVLHPTPSYIDSIPVKMLEYMAAGMPFIASEFGWIKEIVEKFKCGLLVDPLKPEEIASAIRYLLDNDAEAKAMGERGRQAVLSEYNWETEKKKLLNLYSDLLA